MKKRLSVDLPVYLHDLVAEICKKRNITISIMVVRALIEKMIRDQDLREEK